MAPFSPHTLTPQKRQIEQSLEKADNVLRSGGMTLSKRTFYGSCKRTRLLSKPRTSLEWPIKEKSDCKKADVYEFDENGETCQESNFTHIIKPHEIGFPNPPGTNVCWMNATLQIVLGMKCLIDELQTPVCGNSVSRNRYSTILQTFLDVVRQHKRGRLLPVHKDLSNLRSVLATLDSGFAYENQQDAPEFLIRLLDNFREDFYEVGNIGEKSSGETIVLKELKLVNCSTPTILPSLIKKQGVNPICDNLQFSMKEKYCCISCSSQTDRTQEHLALYVDILLEKELSASIMTALEQYMRIHTRELRCEKCKGEQCCVKTVFSQLPRIILIQVKRYTCLEHLTQKITSSIEIPLELNVGSFVEDEVVLPKPWKVDGEQQCYFKDEKSREKKSKDADEIYEDESDEEENEEENIKYSYRLTGILSHHGDNPNTGHYVADVYHHVPRRWYHYDDENVECVREDEILDESRERNGYLFVYTYKALHNQLLSDPRDGS